MPETGTKETPHSAKEFAVKMRLAKEAARAERNALALQAEAEEREAEARRPAAPPPRPEPEIDPEREVALLTAQGLGVEPPPPPPPRTPYVEDDETPERQAALLVVELLEEERARRDRERAQARDDPQQGITHRDRGRPPLELMVEAPEMPNPFAFEDPDTGENLLKPGYLGHWSRVKGDVNDRVDNRQRLRERLAWGAEVIKTRAGDELRTETLVATQIPIRREAQRKIYLSDAGAYDNIQNVQRRTVDRLHQEADDINTAYSRRHHGGGKGVVHLEPMPGHGAHYGPADEGDE